MQLDTQRRLAARALKCGETRISFAEGKLKEISEAITSQDIRKLIQEGAIDKKREAGTSKGRFRKELIQRRKGRRQNMGSRKGRLGVRMGKKRNWIRAIRAQRTYLQMLRENGGIEQGTFRKTYTLAGGGFFRSKKHIRLYLEEHSLIHGNDRKTNASRQKTS